MSRLPTSCSFDYYTASYVTEVLLNSLITSNKHVYARYLPLHPTPMTEIIPLDKDGVRVIVRRNPGLGEPW